MYRAIEIPIDEDNGIFLKAWVSADYVDGSYGHGKIYLGIEHLVEKDDRGVICVSVPFSASFSVTVADGMAVIEQESCSSKLTRVKTGLKPPRERKRR